MVCQDIKKGQKASYACIIDVHGCSESLHDQTPLTTPDRQSEPGARGSHIMAAESSKIDVKDLSQQQLADWLKDRGRRPFRTDQILRWVYLRQADRFEEMTNIAKPLQADLEAAFINPRLPVENEAISQDGSRKLLFRLRDGLHIETVIIPEKDHFTLCISSQVGCRHGCRFCMTAKGGFARNLSAGEIISQVRDVLHQVNAQGGMPLTNIVFMGMGEPLANYDNVVQALASDHQRELRPKDSPRGGSPCPRRGWSRKWPTWARHPGEPGRLPQRH